MHEDPITQDTLLHSKTARLIADVTQLKNTADGIQECEQFLL